MNHTLSTTGQLKQALYAACWWEATAPKLGNVHPGASFDDLTYEHFLKAAQITAEQLLQSQRNGYGATVLQCILRCREELNTNANLGIVLLLTPLTMCPTTQKLSDGLPDVIDCLDQAQTQLLFEAIRIASPGGLGEVDNHDVHTVPKLGVRDVMALAADRDQIARAYSNNYADLFTFGLPVLLNSDPLKEHKLSEAILELQLRWLAREPDTLIIRKSGLQAAKRVQQKAIELVNAGGLMTATGREQAIELDRWLRLPENRYNPGTTADLIAATLFIAFRERLISIPQSTGTRHV